MELGWESPLLSLPDADMEDAADISMMANFFSSDAEVKLSTMQALRILSLVCFAGNYALFISVYTRQGKRTDTNEMATQYKQGLT